MEQGIDDVLALLLAFSATEEELEILLVSVTYGNVTLADCFCNTISLLRHIRAESEWRGQQGHDLGFAALRACKPVLALGPQACLVDESQIASFLGRAPQRPQNGETSKEEHIPVADERHDIDGSWFDHPHINDPVPHTYEQFCLNSRDGILGIMDRSAAMNNEQGLQAIKEELHTTDALFSMTTTAAHEEILRILGENETNTVTIVALGPLTNLALAMANDATTFSRAQEIVVMGGDLGMTSTEDLRNLDNHDILQSTQKDSSCYEHFRPDAKAFDPPFHLTTQAPGPIRDALIHRNQAFPKAEFNTFADPVAAAYIYNSTSSSTFAMQPPTSPQRGTYNKDYHCQLSSAIDITLFTHDVTVSHLLAENDFREVLGPLVSQGSPLAIWLSNSLIPSFEKSSKSGSTSRNNLSLNDPLCILYCLGGKDAFQSKAGWQILADQDVRVKVAGEWTKGATVLNTEGLETVVNHNLGSSEIDHITPSNKLRRCIGIPDKHGFGRLLLSRVSS